jgi:excisionase family DNA binding protein
MLLRTIREVAAQLSCSAKYVRKLIKDGSLRAVRLGREWRVDQEELDLFVKRRTV